MTRKTILSSILIGLIGIAAIVALFLYFQYRELRPDYQRDYVFPGLNSPVTVQIDSAGVAHLFAENESDLIKAQGFYVASERLWQMELMRRTGSGRLSEIFGDTTLKIDRLFKMIDLEGLSDRLYQSASPESRQWMEWFAEGVNAYIQAAGDELPLEFQILQLKAEPWLPQHSIMIERVMAWILNISWRADYLYFWLSQKLSPELFTDLLPDDKAYTPTIFQKPQAVLSLMKGLYETQQQLYRFWGIAETGFGSNNWVINGKRTRSGQAILANDPHLFLSIPSIWIELHLECPRWTVAGFSIPGTPGIVIGRNRHFAWGMTNAMVDDADFFLERVDWQQQTYVQNGEPRPLKQKEIPIRIKNRVEKFTVYFTDNGPIVNSLLPEGQKLPALSVKWTGWDLSDELQTFIRLARGQDWEDFRQAIAYYWAPAQNFVYADQMGNIGYQLGGAIPVRSYATGLLPVPGDREAFRWKGYRPFQQLPHLYNPEWGFIVTANNKIDHTFYISQIWEPPFRAERITQMLLEQKEGFDVADMVRIQLDVDNLLARDLLPEWLEALEAMEWKAGESLLEDILQIFENWDYRMDTESIAATIFEYWMHQMIRELFSPFIGEEGMQLLTDNITFYFQIFHRLMKREHSSWFTRHPLGGKRPLIQHSFQKAVEALQQELGRDVAEWRWGRMHQLYLKHALGEVWALDRIFNVGPYPVAGSVFTVNVAGYRYADPFGVVLGPSMRFVVDWGEPEVYYSMLPGGNSGNPFSRFYANRLEAWIRGEVQKVYMNRTWKPLYAFKITPFR
ncbi:MAG: penicillin acylase family protein [Calditrichaeota bacterium]|nr:penicillin acylase family protein [Calditrichota bacterium]